MNPQHPEPQSGALPIELYPPCQRPANMSIFMVFVKRSRTAGVRKKAVGKAFLIINCYLLRFPSVVPDIK